MKPSLILIPSHVQRTDNKVVGKLANEGEALTNNDFFLDTLSHPTHPLLQQCLALEDSDFPSRDGAPCVSSCN